MKNEIRYYVRRALGFILVALIAYLLRTYNVFAASAIELEPSNVYGYTNTNNNFGNITSTKTSVQSGGNTYFWRFSSSWQKQRLSYTYIGDTGYYNIQFITYDGDDSYTAFIRKGGVNYNCTYSSSDYSYITQSIGFSQQIGYQLFTCNNVYMTNNGYFDLYLLGNYFDSTGTMSRYFMISKQFTLEKVQSVQEVIDNQNQIAEEQNQQQQVCNIYDKNTIITNNYYLNSIGVETSNSNWGITEYINIYQSTLSRVANLSSHSGVYMCVYDDNKVKINCYSEYDNDTLTFTSNMKYIRFSINKNSNLPQFKICKNGNQAISDSTNNLNDTLNSDNTPDSGSTSSAYDQFDDYVATNGVITSLVLLPVNLFTNVLTSLNGQCVRFSLGSLLGTNIYFDCVDPSDFLGSTLWNVIDVLCSGFFVYHIAQQFIKVFHNLTQLKEGDPIGD